jgi:3-hydroxy-D-aspartate aldolase
MQQNPPALPGMPEDEIDTPALLIELDAFERNLDTMAALTRSAGVKLRPHAKTHKSPVIARLQMTRGAIGQCVQKISEAEVLAWSGVSDIIVTNQIVGATKLARLAALAHIVRIAVCVDDPAQIIALENAAAAAGIRLGVLVEIEVGMQRCGAAPGEPAVKLAQRIASSPHLRFEGLQAYQGRAQHLRSHAERAAAIARAADAVRMTMAGLADVGLECSVVGGGGTGSFELEMASGLFSEIQAGSYCFMDGDYGRNLDRNGEPISTFKQALYVLATVMSTPAPGVAVLDAGLKALAVDSGLPSVADRPDIRFVGASDEHGKLAFSPDQTIIRLGEKLRLVPSHCDPTVDRYDWYVGVRHGRVECVWPITARGALA